MGSIVTHHCRSSNTVLHHSSSPRSSGSQDNHGLPCTSRLMSCCLSGIAAACSAFSFPWQMQQQQAAPANLLLLHLVMDLGTTVQCNSVWVSLVAFKIYYYNTSCKRSSLAWNRVFNSLAIFHYIYSKYTVSAQFSLLSFLRRATNTKY